MQKKFSTKQLVLIALMIGLVFVGSLISFEIPVGLGKPTRIHLGNGFCLIAGVLLGPIWGGFASGAGSALFDISNPLFVASAPLTFLNKFIMGAIAGLFAKKKGDFYPDGKNTLIGGLMGQLAYILLYIGKQFFSLNIVSGIPKEGAWGVILTKLVASFINAVFAVLILYLLVGVLRKKRFKL